MKKHILASTMVAVLTLAVMAAGPGITKANYDLLKKGMTYAEVASILGKDGDLVSESENDRTKTQMYSWKPDKKDRASLGASLTVIFQNDGLEMKSQFGLK